MGKRPVAFTKEVSLQLAKRPLVFNGRLANRGLTSLVKEATVNFAEYADGQTDGRRYRQMPSLN